jgi:hypothetical protein
MTPHPVAVCTEGCEVYAKDGAVLGPRQLLAEELAAHDDKHVSFKARALVRMLREASPEVRTEVLDYFTGAIPRYATLLEDPGEIPF